VAFRAPHRSHAVENAAECYPIPDGVSFEQAVWFALAKITFHGARAAGYSLGDSVLVVGTGPIGQMSIRWAGAAGCAQIIAVDAAEHRLPLAKAGGGKLPRVVIDSTGNAAVFTAVLGLAADFGKIVIMGDTGTPARQALTSDVITRGLSIVGAHDVHNTAEWNVATITALFFELIASGRFPMAGLTSHVFTPENAAEAYVTANRDRATTMGLIFDWTGEVGSKK
jgi:threonine dehydrogenase-like Zn-dependent dehydrogenase